MQNGGFETGDFSSWVLTAQSTIYDRVVASGFDDDPSHSGMYLAQFGNSGGFGNLSQTIQTTATTCTLAFYSATYQTATESDSQFFFAYIDDEQLQDASTTTANGDYILYSAMFEGSGGEQILSFGFRNDPSYYLLDDVSVTCDA